MTLDLHGWRVRPFAELEAEARVEVQAALASTHHYAEGVESEHAVAMLLEIDRLREVLAKTHRCLEADSRTHGCCRARISLVLP